MLGLLGYSLLLVMLVGLLFLLAVLEAAAIEVRQRSTANLLEFQPKQNDETPGANPDRDIRRAA